MAEPYYTTADLLRAELGLDATALPDATAISTIEDAEDIIDNELGARDVDPATGRKVTEAGVLAWQWAKIGRATVKLAKLLYLRPDLATTQAYRRVKGPDFELQDPIGSALGTTIDALIAATGLIATEPVEPSIGVVGVTRSPAAVLDWSQDQTLLGRCNDPDLPQ